ncbi:MAG: PEP/pyruvate-binding domain-containing protein [Candidatus Kapaibacterium sp.]
MSKAINASGSIVEEVHALEGGATPNRYTVSLDNQKAMLDQVGGKGMSLIRLRHFGMPVPDAFIVTTKGLRTFLAQNVITLASGVEAIRQGKMPDDISTAIEEGLQELGSFPVAVRSSAVAEDGVNASFAGQYTTVLNCTSHEEVVEAVKECWASVVSAEAQSYSERQKGRGEQEMAVVVQKMVQADAAGVLFTADPVSGDRKSLVLNMVEGLGDRLVSGEVTPDELKIQKGEITTHSGIPSYLSKSALNKLAEYGTMIEKEFGRPQDIEWGVEGNAVYILQSRPITTLPDVEPVPIEIDPPSEGSWELDTIYFPHPPSPLFASTYFPMYNNATRTAFGEFGTLIDGIEGRVIGGRTYVRVIPPMGKEGNPPPPFLMKLLFKLMPPLRKKAAAAQRAAESNLAKRMVMKWKDEWYNTYSSELDTFRRLDLGKLDKQTLLAELQRLIRLASEMETIHFRLAIPHMLAVTDFLFFCQEELGWEPPKTTSLFGGLSTPSAEPGRALAELAAEGIKRTAVAELLADPSRRSMEHLREIDSEFATAVERYLNRWGLQVPGYEFEQPTYKEQPGLVLGWIAGQIAQEYNPDSLEKQLREKRERILDEGRELLKNRPAQLERFGQLLSHLKDAYGARDENELVSLSFFAAIRLTALEVGKRMVEQNQLDQPEDIFFLQENEVFDWFSKERSVEQLVRRRKGERLWAETHNHAPIFGPAPGDPPDDLSFLPKDMQRLMRGLLWFIKNELTASGTAQQGNVLTGNGGSAGSYTGPARIVKSTSDFNKIQPGDVLVCSITTPGWSPLFSTIGALVTNVGGLLSHPAIISREYGIPAVLATVNGTELLQDGEIVTVDGTAGRVTRTSQGPSEQGR